VRSRALPKRDLVAVAAAAGRIGRVLGGAHSVRMELQAPEEVVTPPRHCKTRVTSHDVVCDLTIAIYTATDPINALVSLPYLAASFPGCGSRTINERCDAPCPRSHGDEPLARWR